MTGTAAAACTSARLRFAAGAGAAGTAGGHGEAWYVISGAGHLETERVAGIALVPGTAVWLEPGLGYTCQAEPAGDLEILAVTVRSGSAEAAARPGRPGRWSGGTTVRRSAPGTGNSGCCSARGSRSRSSPG